MNGNPDWFDQITSFSNLARATKRAARGKRQCAAVARFLFRLEPELLQLQRELRAGNWRPGKPYCFPIQDPKPRIISAAPFRDRVVHHALIDVLEPTLESAMSDSSLACRRGKGTHLALRLAHGLMRRRRWFLKLDVKSCFPSMDHDVVLRELASVVQDCRTLKTFERIVRHGGQEGRSLPIGNLTSQWLANLTLSRLDRHVEQSMRPAGYLRYMDDFVLFDDDQERLRAWHGEIAAFLAEDLRLHLKHTASILAPTHEGLPFLGFRVYPGLLRLRPQNLRRTRARLRLRRHQWESGRIDDGQYADCMRSVVAHLAHGNTLRLRRRLFAADAERSAADPIPLQPLQPRRQL